MNTHPHHPKVFEKLISYLFRDNRGTLVIAQRPNLPLIGWIIAMAIAALTKGSLQRIAHLLAYGLIFTWAWLEITQGRSRFRRLLGCAVLTIAVTTAH